MEKLTDGPNDASGIVWAFFRSPAAAAVPTAERALDGIPKARTTRDASFGPFFIAATLPNP